MSQRAPKLGFGSGGMEHGFESFPTKTVEMPPTWALVLVLVFLIGSLGVWVSNATSCPLSRVASIYCSAPTSPPMRFWLMLLRLCRHTLEFTFLPRCLVHLAGPKSNTSQYYLMGIEVKAKSYHAG